MVHYWNFLTLGDCCSNVLKLNKSNFELFKHRKLISECSKNHTIARIVNSGNINEIHSAHIHRWSLLLINFSFLDQSLQGNPYSLLNQQLYSQQNYLQTEAHYLCKRDNVQQYGLCMTCSIPAFFGQQITPLSTTQKHTLATNKDCVILLLWWAQPQAWKNEWRWPLNNFHAWDRELSQEL